MLVVLLRGTNVAVDSSSHRWYVFDVSKKTPTSVPMLKPWKRAYIIIWQRNPQPGDTALQKHRQMPRQQAIAVLPRHLQQFDRNAWRQLQKQEQHIVDAFSDCFKSRFETSYDMSSFNNKTPLWLLSYKVLLGLF